jgi:hypothetical protein
MLHQYVLIYINTDELLPSELVFLYSIFVRICTNFAPPPPPVEFLNPYFGLMLGNSP